MAQNRYRDKTLVFITGQRENTGNVETRTVKPAGHLVENIPVLDDVVVHATLNPNYILV